MPDVRTIVINKIEYDIADTYAREELNKKLETPSEGNIGQVLTYTNTGPQWVDHTDAPSSESVQDYTAFEVYPTDHDIPIGSNEIGLAVWGDATLTVNTVKINASMTEEFSLWITKSRLESDIIIDWGDGIVEKLSELIPTSGTDNDGQIDVLVYVAHTYEVPNKVYTIKIYGNDYCRLSHNSYKLSGNNRLMVRALSDDLPLARHLNNLASYCYGSRRLLKIQMPSYSSLFNQVTNWSGCFNTCQNLISCTGWALAKTVVAYNALFQYCDALKETDFYVGKLSYSSVTNVFDRCKNLEYDILSLVSSKFNTGIAEVNAGGVFRNCKKLGMGYDTYIATDGGSVSYLITQDYYDSNKDNQERLTAIEASLKIAADKLASRLWRAKDIIWTGTSTCFSGAPDIIRKFVPVSWGGTNASVDVALQITDEMKVDYTAWEVYPNDHIIAAGSTELGEKVWGDDTLKVTYDIPVSLTEEFSLWITKSRLESDIIIDWGDGVVEKLAELTPTAGADKDGQADVSVYVAHTYEVPNQVYTIKIYGKDYCRISRNSTKLNANNRLLCKCFTKGLPIASHLTNLASFCYSATRLLKVSVESYSNIFLDVINLSSLFEGCKNLIAATGFNRLTNDIVKGGVSNIFSGNYALVTTDFVFPENTTACRNTFLNCQRLENTVNSFFPTNGLISKAVDITRIFGNCKKLQGTVNGNILWGDLTVDWFMDPTAANGTKMTPFTGCSDEILAQVPVSWGGIASEPIKMTIKIPTLATISDDLLHTLTLTIEVSDSDTFAEVVSYTETDCKVFDPIQGMWVPFSDIGFTTNMTNTFLKLELSHTYDYIRYRWNTGLEAGYWQTI